MTEEFDEGRDLDEMPPAGYSIDERFDFSVGREFGPANPAESDRAASDPGRRMGETAPTPPGEEPGGEPESWRADVSEDPLIGRMVGNYQVLHVLGRGGFGTVYKARDTKLDRMVALKFLRFPLDPEYRRLFSREAKVLANLSKHPSIVQIYTWDEYQGSYYFALEYLDCSAESLVEQSGGRLSVRQALEITAECAGALEFAHQQGVLHRDIKPANILIDHKTDRAKLCDFGLARFHNLGTGTVSAHIAGSPPYMAPEQVSGGKIDPRTDVYALGITLYELLSGRVPVEGSSQAEIFQRIRKRKATPLNRHRGDLPPSVLKVVRRATAWRPDDRFQSAGEFERALNNILERLETSGTPEPTLAIRPLRGVSRNHVFRIAGALVLAALAVGAVIAVVPQFPPRMGQNAPLTALPVAVAQAKELIDRGNYAEAKTALEAYLDEHPDDDFGRYALGYANYLLGDLAAAKEAFERVSDDALRLEGLAAVAVSVESDNAQPAVEEALAIAPTRYPALLLSLLDITKGNFADAVDRLEKVQAERLAFGWQRRELYRLLGQTYFKLGRIDDAGRILARLPQGDPVAAGYLELAQRDQARKDRESLRQQVKEVRALWDKMGAVARQDTWTSRPFTLAVIPSKDVPTPSAVGLGLPDLLPESLSEALDRLEPRPISFVDRENVDEIIRELERSSYLGSEDERLQMQRLIGARLLMKVTFLSVGERQIVKILVMDAETTHSVLQKSFEYQRTDDPPAIAERIAAALQDAVEQEYPIQARLTAEDGEAVLNVGKKVGLKPGTRFSLMSSPKAPPLDGIRAIATGRMGDGQTVVELEGVRVDELPASGLYAEEDRA